MTTITKRLALLFVPFILLACGGGGGGSSTGSDGTDESAAVAVPDNDALPAVSWYSAAAPLVERYCLACHRDGGLAPFPLETYDQVLSMRSALVYSLETDTMPPPGYADLTAAESELLLQWAEDGAPKGHPSQSPLPVATGAHTYHGDIRPLLEQHCVACHTAGGIAPFPLDTYQDVRGTAAAMAYSIKQGTMPPWPPTEGYTDLDHSRRLPPQDKHLLLNWLKGDMPEGNPLDYSPPQLADDNAVVDYDLELSLPQPYTPILRPDDHRCFAVEWPLDEFTYVTDVDVLPDQAEEVHHVIVSIAEPEDAHMYYAASGADGNPGWYCLGAGGVSGAPLPRQIGGWVPGAGREPPPAGTGVGVKPGSVMVVQMHYNTLVAEPTPDQSTVLVATAPEVDRPASNFLFTDPRFLRPGGMPIPANEADVHHEVSVPAGVLGVVFGAEAGLSGEDPWVLHQTFLHMHNLGSSGRVTLQRRNGTEQVLLDIRDWDFNWQGTYRFSREVLIQPQDSIKLECNWDNSQANQPFVDGEQLASQDVEWGDGTQDEMCLMSVYMTRVNSGYDYSYSPSVYIESPGYRQQFRAGDLVPLRLVLNNFSLQDPGAHSHSEGMEHSDGAHGSQQDDHSAVYSGHYHVYLDTDDDDAEHLTAWDDNYYFQLPDALEPGIHRLRVSLRGHDHHTLGIEHEVEIEVIQAGPEDSASLVEAADWREQSIAGDSLADHRPPEVDCPANSWYLEGDALEVETGYCNYLSLVQQSKTDIRAGDEVRLVLWHGDLAFEEPARGHVAVSIAGETLWEQEVEIPAEAEIFDVRIPVNKDVPAGSEVEFHLHNHGYNTWTLLKLEVLR